MLLNLVYIKIKIIGVLANNHLATNFYTQVGYQTYGIVYEKYLSSKKSPELGIVMCCKICFPAVEI